jgi:hypothetical protein
MTDLEKKFCEQCSKNSDCGYVTRNLEDRCFDVDVFSQGVEAATEKACEFLKVHRDEVETEDNGIAGWIPDSFIENFKKAMEE